MKFYNFTHFSCPTSWNSELCNQKRKIKSRRKLSNRTFKSQFQLISIHIRRELSVQYFSIEDILILTCFSIFFSRLQNIREEIKISEFYQRLLASLEHCCSLKSTLQVICLGIGRIGDCLIAKHQIALIQLIAEHFHIASLSFYDPVLTEQEKSILEHYKYTVLTENKEGKYLTDQPTLFYLPHCPKQLTNNLLWTNWNPANLQNLTLISNSFKTIIEETPERLLRPNAYFIIESSSFVDEIAIENLFKFDDIFNNFAIHHFDENKLSAIEENFWGVKPEPTYASEDLELVTNDVSLEKSSLNSP